MNELLKLIEAFERRCGLKICLHDYSGKIVNYLGRKKYRHDNKYCDYVKEKTGLRKCLSFEMRKVQIMLTQYPDGFFKICHGGIIEYVMPIMKDANILGTMFIGSFRLKLLSGLPDIIVCKPDIEDLVSEPAMKLYEEIALIEKEDFKDIEEIAKALKCRIETMIAKEEEIFVSHEEKIKWEIEKYIGLNCQKDINIQALAKHLCLSISRTGQIIKKLFDMTYPELLNKNRIKNAKILLASTSLSISETAYRCGFSDSAYFHRTFKKIEKTTPGKYKAENNKIKKMLT